ncbi:MAG: O-antigen ligase family protein [Minisyncoccia bacterium]
MNKNTLRLVIISGLFLVPFIPFLVYSNLFFPFITSKAFTWRIIVEIVFALWAVLAVVAPEYRPKKSIIFYALTAFIVAIGISDLFGMAPVKSFWSNYERMEGYITLLHLEAFFVVLISVFKEKDWTRWWNTSLVASFLMSLYCFSQLLGISQINQGGVRVDGTFGNAAYLAVYLLIHIFIAILFIVREKKGSLLRLVYGSLIFVQLVVLYNTATRGSILGLIGGLILVSLLNIWNKESASARRVSLITLGAIIILVGGFYTLRNAAFVQHSPVLQRFASISISSVKTEGRSFIWPMAVRGIKEHPLLGWGQENFNYVFNQFYDPKMYNLEPWFDRAHNIFLDWGVAGGLLGLALYLSLYVVLLISIWKKDDDMHYIEKSVLTGLIAGYFFHNLFVFDQLISYILFISLLAYVHSRTVHDKEETKHKEIEENISYVLAPAVVGLILVLYFVNFQPMIANTSLIQGLQTVQSPQSDKKMALVYFKNAYDISRLGRPETVEWITSSADSLLRADSTLKNDDKLAYFNFAKDAMTAQLAELPTDTRYRLIAGSFYGKVGLTDESIKNLEEAKRLSPGKQSIYFTLGSVYVDKKDFTKALAEFKAAYDLAPGYPEARIAYMVGAIYADRLDIVNEMSKTLGVSDYAKDQRVINALMNTNRNDLLENLLNSWIKMDPQNQDAYITLASFYMKIGNKDKAISTLATLAENVPGAKDQADEYIKQIKNSQTK